MKVEICSTSFESSLNAELAGATRIELCSELAMGGVTPSLGLVKQIKEKLNIPVFVLIRPRSGNFVYTQAEVEVMKTDIELCKELGVEGIVSGVLTSDFQVDEKRTKELIACTFPLEFTFHRAFDCVEDPFRALKELVDLGVNRILTSGQKSSAVEGLEELVKFQEFVGNECVILPGGGIHPSNKHLFQQKGFKEIHASASQIVEENPQPKVAMLSEKFYTETKIYRSDLQIIKQLTDENL